MNEREYKYYKVGYRWNAGGDMSEDQSLHLTINSVSLCGKPLVSERRGTVEALKKHGRCKKCSKIIADSDEV